MDVFLFYLLVYKRAKKSKKPKEHIHSVKEKTSRKQQQKIQIMKRVSGNVKYSTFNMHFES